MPLDPEELIYTDVSLTDDEDYPESWFPAVLIRGDRWNGWACPSFDRETVDRLIHWLDTVYYCDEDGIPDYEGCERVSWDGDDVLITSPDCDGGEPWVERIPPNTRIDGVPRWSVGACSWTWSDRASIPERQAYWAERNGAYA